MLATQLIHRRQSAVRSEVVDDIRQQLGQAATRLLLADARLRGDLRDPVIAEDLRQGIGIDGFVVLRSKPRTALAFHSRPA